MTDPAALIEDIQLELSAESVWKWLGARRGAVSALAGEVASMISLGRILATPRATYGRRSIESIEREGVRFEDGPLLEGRALRHLFAGAQEAIFMVVTIGHALEAKVSELFTEGRSIEAFVLDAVGSAAIVDVFSQTVQRVLEETSQRGWATGLCLRPGQSYWDISGQKSIFQVVAADRVGVRLLDSCFMVPQKTQSTVIPLGPNLRVHGDPEESYCRYCTATRCPMREELLAT